MARNLQQAESLKVKAVIDTNVLVSAIWSVDGKPAIIIERILQGEFKPVYDDRMMDECLLRV
jgi:predicted nucleic acid-binding protein